ncbi:KIF1-binding protein [Rhinatrema bivittatum]|uniref:KIF1-binding protein n=1 Tax=Rhinatrema bivittatum TaxID=194408 RepID=UPI00112B495B|nr:KIF1-binding protein [Rhinatrema bivittatum]
MATTEDGRPETWQELCNKYQRSVALAEVESKRDPENEPYRSRYRARELLEQLRAELTQEEEVEVSRDNGRALALPRALVEFQLGVNLTETDELSAGEEHLQRVLNSLRHLPPGPENISLILQCQNKLGILWAERGEIQTALLYLEAAEDLYNQYMKKIGKPPLDLSEYFMIEEEKLTEQERSKRFESVYTHTLYYLAQVYQHLEMNEKAAQYCHTTLQRQLQYSSYDPVEWAINAAMLSQYYLGKQWYMEARHCLAAANVVFNQAGQVPSAEAAKESEEEQERLGLLQQRRAEIARCWIKYCLNLMQDARKMLEDIIGELDTDRQDDMKAQRLKDAEEKEKGRKKAVLFGSSDLSDSILAGEEKVTCTYPLDFEEAREIFLLGQTCVQEAKGYFQLDGHVTDHIKVLQDHSALFKVLAFFEEDYERRCKMHKRRVDMLEPIVKELSPQFYLLICRQLQFEVAGIYYEMMDLKVAIGNKLEELDSHTIRKINSLAQCAIKNYEIFLDLLKDPEKKFPEKLEEDVLRPAMVAKFHIARLYGKLITSDGKKQLENMQLSLENYIFLVEYCKKHEDAIKAVETELELSKEMVDLLPTKMERLRMKLSLA